MDRSSPNVFVERRRNRGNVSFPILDILSRSVDIRVHSQRLYKIDRNFACFWPPIFLGGELPEFLESIYKINTGSYHVAKFRGDWPRELGD